MPCNRTSPRDIGSRPRVFSRRKLARVLAGGAVATSGWLALAGARLPMARGAVSARLVLAHGEPAGSHVETLLLKPWAQRVVALSRGRIAIDLAPLAGAPAALMRGMREGRFDLAWAPAGAVTGAGSAMEVLELPFLAWPSAATSQAATALARRHKVDVPDVRFLFFHVGAPMAIHMRATPVRGLEDLKGRRLYAPTRLLRDFLARAGSRALGGPDWMAEAVVEALESGDLHGAVASFTSGVPAGIVARTRYHTVAGRPPRGDRGRRPGLGARIHALMANPKRLDGLPAEDRALFHDSTGIALAETAGRTWDGLERLRRREALGAGHVLYALPSTEARRWRRIAASTADDWIAAVNGNGLDGSALITEARRLISAYHALMSDEDPARTHPRRDQGG